MPHCIIEHSSTLDGEVLMPLVFTGMMNSELFQVDDVKVRTQSFSHYQTAHEKTDFIHVTLKILSGRNTEQKSRLSQCVLEQITTLGLTEGSISVEVMDIDRASYVKVVL
ncbi:5-carboxymethyl-2-hydroxymuconate Delta-isomerase [Marinomonas sp. 2405UD68-3]|uniref:5-carboxymethyl-2-hydroxymuconate Delta-isomerase n=1 Tax=Marinomonas sp. 2405UD68-3 TaxID=3391835 RepID=UPI0039C9FAA9